MASGVFVFGPGRLRLAFGGQRRRAGHAAGDAGRPGRPDLGRDHHELRVDRRGRPDPSPGHHGQEVRDHEPGHPGQSSLPPEVRQVVRPSLAHPEQREAAGEVRRPLRSRPERGPGGVRVLPREEPEDRPLRDPAPGDGSSRLRPAQHRRRPRSPGLHPGGLHPRPSHGSRGLPGLLHEAPRLAARKNPSRTS